MSKIVYKFNEAPFSLHDMNIIEFEVKDNDVFIRTQSGIVMTSPPYSQIDGHVEIHNVRWDYSYVYLLEHTGNIGSFSGEKIFLKDFIDKNKVFGFSVMDTLYAYNQIKLDGYLLMTKKFFECFFEIYHEGDIVFVSE